MKKILYIFSVLFSIFSFSQDLDWAKVISSNGQFISLPISHLDSNGNIISTGYFEGNIDFDAGGGTFFINSFYDGAYIIKYDPIGNFIWAKSFEGSDDVRAKSLVIDDLNNIYSVGNFYGNTDFNPDEDEEFEIDAHSFGSNDIYISKLNSEGGFVWAKSVGGDSWDIPYSIALSPDQNFIYITGYFRSTVDFDPGEGLYNLSSLGAGDMYLLKLDTDGNFVWVNQIGGGSGDSGHGVDTDQNGNVYVTGDFRGTASLPDQNLTITSNGSDDVYLAKYAENSDLIWIKTFGGENVDTGRSVHIDGNGDIYVTGVYEGTVDFDPSENNYFLTSLTDNTSIFVSKYDSNGNFIWAKSLNNPIATYNEYGLNTDSQNYVYLSGYFEGEVDFDPGSETHILQSNGNRAGYVLKLSPTGDFVWVLHLDGDNESSSNVRSIIFDSLGNIISTGTTSENVDLDPTENTFYTEQGGIFILKLNQEILSSDDQWDFYQKISVYPNPVINELTIQYDKDLYGSQYSLYDLLGRQLQSGLLKNVDGKELIHLSQNKGVYILRLKTREGKEYSFKIIKS